MPKDFFDSNKRFKSCESQLCNRNNSSASKGGEVIEGDNLAEGSQLGLDAAILEL